MEGQNAASAARILFLTGAAIMLALSAYGLWKPRAVFEKLKDNDGPKINLLADVVRLLKWWPMYPAMFIWMLWSFSPGSVTVLQYYLSNTLHASDAEYGNWNGLFALAFVPTFVIYGFLCQQVSLRPLLWWGTIIGIPQMIPLIFVHTVTSALWPSSFRSMGQAGITTGGSVSSLASPGVFTSIVHAPHGSCRLFERSRRPVTSAAAEGSLDPVQKRNAGRLSFP